MFSLQLFPVRIGWILEAIGNGGYRKAIGMRCFAAAAIDDTIDFDLGSAARRRETRDLTLYTLYVSVAVDVEEDVLVGIFVDDAIAQIHGFAYGIGREGKELHPRHRYTRLGVSCCRDYRCAAPKQ